MLHAELLHDRASIERGEELVALYIEGLRRLRVNTPAESEQFHDHIGEINETIQLAAIREDMDAGDYEKVGRSVVESQRKHNAVNEWRNRTEVGSPRWRAAFQPASDFLKGHAGKPIVAEQSRRHVSDISSFRFWSRHNPKRIGGYVIPKVVGNAQLFISRRPNTGSRIATLQIIDRDWTAKDDLSYRSFLKLAIGE